jgi:ubiquinone/menaquinone biosynthesis C-methylase UbiE
VGRSRDVERFDQWAETYDRHWMQRIFFDPVQERVLDLAAAEVARPRAILDVGCGTGRLLRKAAARFPDADLLGVDPAPQMLKQAATAAEDSGIHFMEAGAEHLPFPDDRFNLIFSTLTFHHWSDQARAVGEVARVLTPGGRWLLADFGGRGRGRDAPTRARPYRAGPGSGSDLGRSCNLRGPRTTADREQGAECAAAADSLHVA